ncbi:hypothetical protein ACFYNL_34535 [Streptomyces sp. NPDC007808]|uniref:hypothetical protein n=1 Tax=Streptomyces sp. NPDC007808 TaxID=3364779 RepID=UPI003697B3F2
MSIAASVVIAVGTTGSAYADGPDVTATASWGTATFKTHGDYLWVKDKSADGYSVKATLWRDLPGEGSRDDIRTCSDSTTTQDTSDGYSICNFDVSEDYWVSVTIQRYKNGIPYGSLVASGYSSQA